MPEGLSVRGAIAAAEKGRKREYTAKQKKFLTLYAKNNFQNSKECAEKAGYKSGDYHGLVVSLKDDIKEIASSMLLGSAPEAAMALAGILSETEYNPNNPSKLQAAREILDRVGIVKKQEVQHDHKVSGGLFIIPAKAPLPVEDLEVIDGEFEDTDEERMGSQG